MSKCRKDGRCQQAIDYGMEGAGSCAEGKCVQPPPGLRAWFGLSYASWLTMPRVLMEAMPEDWQHRMAGLLREYDAAYPSQPNLGTTVRCTSSSGRLVETPGWITNYRYPNAAEITKCRGGVLEKPAAPDAREKLLGEALVRLVAIEPNGDNLRRWERLVGMTCIR